MRIRKTWHGDELVARSRRANGRAVVGQAAQVSADMASVAHVISGDLKRSIHAAKPETMGEVHADAETAQVVPDEPKWQVEVGSWLAYACVENNRGGAHAFADLGYDLAHPTFDLILKRAWADEGLKR